MFSRTLMTLFTALFLLSALGPRPALAKRAAPAPVKPVTARGVEYQANHERYMDGGRLAGLRAWVEAHDPQSQRLLWKVLVYEIKYDRNRETDVQDVHIRSLAIEPLGLVVTNERDKTYLVDLSRHTAREWKKPKGPGR